MVSLISHYGPRVVPVLRREPVLNLWHCRNQTLTWEQIEAECEKRQEETRFVGDKRVPNGHSAWQLSSISPPFPPSSTNAILFEKQLEPGSVLMRKETQHPSLSLLLLSICFYTCLTYIPDKKNRVNPYCAACMTLHIFQFNVFLPPLFVLE